MRHRLSGFTCALLVAMGAGTTASAQPFTLDQKIKPTELKLQPYRAGGPRVQGRVYGAEITQTDPTQYFFVPGLSIYSPDYVGITSTDPSSKLAVSVHKETWEQAHRKGDVEPNGHWDAKFKTSGDFGVKVTADHVPAKYALLVWTGDEVEAPIPSPFKPRGASTAATAPTTGSGKTGLYVVIALLAGALVGVLLVKSKSSRACLLIGALLTAPFGARAALAQEGDYPKAIADMLEQLKSFLEHQESVKDFWESLEALSQGEAVPDVSNTGPSLPSSCLGADWKVPSSCQCMATAVGKLRANRQMLEKLRILVANQKNFVDKATALGNSFSQLHTVLGLQWIGIKKESIDEPYAQFKTIANQKHKALMEAIEKDLKDISDCEGKLGEPDWYAKYGFLYYEFLYAGYKPAF